MRTATRKVRSTNWAGCGYVNCFTTSRRNENTTQLSAMIHPNVETAHTTIKVALKSRGVHMLALADAAMVGIVSVRLFMMVPSNLVWAAEAAIRFNGSLYCELDSGLPSVH
jgi:hypothetical protein